MSEQIVQYTEHLLSHTGAIPAPMVERAFRLLDILSSSEDGLTLSELARVLDMSKGSIHGLLKTLESCGAIEQNGERIYVLGPKVYDLAQNYLQQAGLRRFALPAMQRLATGLGETLFLGRAEQECVRIIECINDESEYSSLHISAPRGTRVHLLAGATGRLVLASWSIQQRKAFLCTHPLPSFTRHSITNPGQFLAAVEEATRIGIGEDHEEYLIGVNAMAAPIIGPDKSLVALLWIVGFAAHFDDNAMQRAKQPLRSEAEMISRSLGAKI